MSKNPLTKHRVDKEGRLLSDDGPALYMVVEKDNGDEEFIVLSNMSAQVHRSAERFSTGTRPQRENCLVVRSDTHEAIYRYEKDRGLVEGWTETDPQKAARRKAHISPESLMPLPGKKIIRHSDTSK